MFVPPPEVLFEFGSGNKNLGIAIRPSGAVAVSVTVSNSWREAEGMKECVGNVQDQGNRSNAECKQICEDDPDCNGIDRLPELRCAWTH